MEEDVTEAEIMVAKARADAAIAKTKADDEEKKRKLQELREQLPARSPYLETMAGGEKSRVLASKNFKKKIARQFSRPKVLGEIEIV